MKNVFVKLTPRFHEYRGNKQTTVTGPSSTAAKTTYRGVSWCPEANGIIGPTVVPSVCFSVDHTLFQIFEGKVPTFEQIPISSLLAHIFVDNVLGNKRVENYKLGVNKLLTEYRELGCNRPISIKIYFLFHILTFSQAIIVE